MATYTLSPFTRKQFFTDSGVPLASGKIYTYAAGTLTALTTYKTSSGTAWGAYVQLDSAGRPENGEIYLQPGQSYKFIAQNSAGVTQWTQDNIGAVPPSSVNVDITGTAGENISAGDLCYIGSSGSWFKADADAAATSTDVVLGFCVTSASTGETTTFRTDGQIELAGPLSPPSIYYVSGTAGAVTATAPSHLRIAGQAQSTTLLAIALNPPVLSTINHYVNPRIKDTCDGRLTLTTATPVTTGDVTAAATLYWTPFRGNEIALYTGSAWVVVPFTELSVAAPAAANQMYDAFVDYNDGTPILALTAWTNDTTRATALTTQDGVYVKTGDTQQRYVGSVRTVSASQFNDSFLLRHVWNYYNRVPRAMRVTEATNSWGYTLDAWQQANASTANQVSFVIGVAEVVLNAQVQHYALNSGGGLSYATGIGVDTVAAPTAGNVGMYQFSSSTGGPVSAQAALKVYPAVGYHYAAWLERSVTTSGTTTFYGDNNVTYLQSGLQAEILG